MTNHLRKSKRIQFLGLLLLLTTFTSGNMFTAETDAAPVHIGGHESDHQKGEGEIEGQGEEKKMSPGSKIGIGVVSVGVLGLGGAMIQAYKAKTKKDAWFGFLKFNKDEDTGQADQGGTKGGPENQKLVLTPKQVDEIKKAREKLEANALNELTTELTKIQTAS
jgi:hypothetical protein